MAQPEPAGIAGTDAHSDEWEHISEDDDDTFSVISLPTSEDKAADGSIRDHVVVTRPTRGTNNLVHRPCRPSRPPQSEPESESESLAQNSKNAHLHSTGDIISVPGENPPVKKGSAATANAAKPDPGPDPPPTRSREPKRNNNFAVVVKTTGSLLSILQGIQLNKRFGAPLYSLSSKIKTLCTRLYSHLICLEDVLQGYAKHVRHGNGLNELPIGFSDWLRNLEHMLREMQDTMGGPISQDSSSLAMSYASQVKNYHEKLENFSLQMDGLITVIKSDYEDFHTLHMPVLSASEDERQPNHKSAGWQFGQIAPGNTLAHLRRELCRLKDNIAACLGEIEACGYHGITSEKNQRKNMADLSLGYKTTKDALGLMLSNHEGDWIDYSIAGGLTYPEFCRLNPDTIRSLIVQLNEATDDMFLERMKARSPCSRQDLSDSSGNELTIGETTLSTLQTIEEVLVSILCIRKNE
ncbi:hypothetical protein F4777DRAFT_568307 [Nemania sp. FL0916]|nr:hypothetical protein F4777DRAFT_568307 [Nemania sp. FL0916]